MEMLLAEVLVQDGHWPDDAMPFHYIRYGRHASGTYHAAVYFGDRMVHDPLPGNSQPFLPDDYPQTYILFVKR